MAADNDEVAEAQRRLDEAKARAAASGGESASQSDSAPVAGDGRASAPAGAIPTVPRER